MSTTKKGENNDLTWQERLLPLMARTLTGLTIFFFVASFVQLFYLHSRIEHAPTIEAAMLTPPGSLAAIGSGEESLAAERLRVASILEANAIARRYHQANVFLMARVWSNYLGFVTGMTLALLGAAFILGQLRAPASELGAKSQPFEISIRTASPGLALCVLGVALMIATIVSPQEISTTDVPVYLGRDQLPDAAVKKPPLP